jgi:hypothetical protein
MSLFLLILAKGDQRKSMDQAPQTGPNWARLLFNLLVEGQIRYGYLTHNPRPSNDNKAVPCPPS